MIRGFKNWWRRVVSQELRVGCVDVVSDQCEAIFFEDRDRTEFLPTLGQACQKTGCQLHAYWATRWITPLLRELLGKKVEPGLFYNVNLPLLPAGAPDPEVIWCPLDPKPLPLNYRHKEETGLYFAGDYNLRGRTPKADVDVCFTP
jgi:hypothetical protein